MTDYPDLLDGAIDPVVQGIIRDYCGWHIAPSVTETVVLDGPGLAGYVVLPSLMVTEVSSVTVDGVTVVPSSIRWYENGVLWGPLGTSWRGVEVEVTHGYPDTPAALRAVAKRLAQGVPAGGSVRVGNVQVSAGQTNPDGMDIYCAGILNRYKLLPRP